MVPKIPEALSSTLSAPPPDTFTLITSVLGATSSWLLLRYLHVILNAAGSSIETVNDGGQNNSIVFVSWLKPFAFWNAEAKRVLGLDLSKQADQGKLVFVDAMTSLFLPPDNGNGKGSAASALKVGSPALAELSKAVAEGVNLIRQKQSSSETKTTLVLDAPSIILQTSSNPIAASAFAQVLMALRSQVNSMIVALPADEPLLTPSLHHTTALETENSSFLASLAHQSDVVITCRLLETGWANDVSGVIRVTKGGGSWDGHNDDLHLMIKSENVEGEWLYYVAGDGSVDVWHRGSVR